MQIARNVFLMNLNIMKKILDLIAFKTDKKSDDYKYYKQEIMEATYSNLKKLFRKLEEEKISEKCSCGANFRKGYKSCNLCGGSGFCNRKN
ncbi:unnamed protein product [marine sediment metagenome]|uniref:Uncharacterized protein n=1 Tax=marine sediment metagenome TaxID=412755 RepID=X0YZQ3_9ZZZZ